MDAAKVRSYRDEHDCSLQEAQRAIAKQEKIERLTDMWVRSLCSDTDLSDLVTKLIWELLNQAKQEPA